VMAEMDDVLEVMRHPRRTIKIPDKEDRRYALCSAAAYYVWRGKDSAEQQLLLDGFFKIAIDLPGDFSAMLIIDALQSAVAICRSFPVNSVRFSGHSATMKSLSYSAMRRLEVWSIFHQNIPWLGDTPGKSQVGVAHHLSLSLIISGNSAYALICRFM